MREKTTIVKRIFMMFLVVWITFVSVFGAYQKSVEAAEWVAGTIAAIGGAPILSALLIGGVVVAGGIAVYELSQTSAEDHRNFVDGIKNGFNEFVADQEKQIALEQDSSLTDQQAADRGVAAARDTINNFTDNAINVTRTTAKNLKTKTVQYWNKYCKQVSHVADNGISEGNGNITQNTVINTNTLNFDNDLSVLGKGLDNVGANTVQLLDKYYLYKGVYGKVTFAYNQYSVEQVEYEATTTLTDRVIIPYLIIINDTYNNRVQCKTINLHFNKLTGAFITYTEGSFINTSIYQTTATAIINQIINNTSIKCVICNNSNYSDTRNRIRDNIGQLAVSAGAASVPIWLRSINSTLTNTHMGQAIRSGRRAKLQAGDYIGSTFVDDSIPLKKTALRVGDTTTVGKVGWDIPQPDVWDDVFSGGRPFSDVVRDTGVVGVPSDDVSSYPTDTEVEFPTDTDVQDTDDVIDIPSDDEIDIDDEIEIPERPLPDIIEDQEGDFYPTEMDLTQLFPFCIPFDIIYLVEKFDVSGANAPVITLPLKYPAAIRGAMGSDRYEVTIDLADYVVVRDVIRVFLLLLFIAGLMKVTRDLIRG